MGKISKPFQYDVIKLLKAVKERPCLWDKSLECYKDRIERKNAWEEIFHILDNTYDSMSAENQRITGAVILNRWTNIRDTFVRTLRGTNKQKRKYLLYDHLSFLTPVVSKETEAEGEAENSIDETTFKREVEEDPPKTTRKRKKKNYNQDFLDDTPEEEEKPVLEKDENEFNYVELNEDPRIMNEDEAFFASLLPSVVKYNEDERLQFRIEVLNIMKQIKDSRSWNNQY